MPAPTITPLPDPPLRSQQPSTFTSKAEAWVAALSDFVTEANILAAYLEGLTGSAGPITATALTMATARILGRTSTSTGAIEELTAAQVAAFLGTNVKSTESLIIACSDETTALTAGTGKVTFRMPYAFTLSAVRASLTTAQASGSIFTVDINEGGASILSTKLTIDNTEKTSTTAATAAVISDSAIADDAEMTIDIDQIGDGAAKGLKVYLIGSRT